MIIISFSFLCLVLRIDFISILSVGVFFFNFPVGTQVRWQIITWCLHPYSFMETLPFLLNSSRTDRNKPTLCFICI